MPRPLLAIAVLCFGALTASAAGGERSIWSALVLAKNSDHPGPPRAELARFQDKLENVFGYNHFELIAHYAQVMDDPSERWIILSKTFFLRVAANEIAKDSYLLHLQLFQGPRMLVETHAKLGPQSPLFIRGPMRGDGQIIIVLLVK